tara:strand:- start:1240 stop:1455 length:216 start_codon:yes stop_codon:yes gene_type:complete
MLSEVFWIAFISTISGLLIKICSMAYKSKCKNISCCFNCFTLERDVFLEEKEEELRMNLKKQPSINSNECL